jgi:hypothetical protein
MGIQEEITTALEEDREETISVLAEHRVVPVVVEDSEFGSSNLLGGTSTPDFSFERHSESETEHVTDRQTRTRVIDALGLDSEDKCEEVQEEIRSHEAWGRAD